MLIDSHCHLDFPQYADRSLQDIIEEAARHDVHQIITIGCSRESIDKTCTLAQADERIFAAVGIHPHDCEKLPANYLKHLEQAIQLSDVVALGEIGLDYSREHDKIRQQQVFREQLSLAKKNNLPVILHGRDAYPDMIEVLDSFPTGTFRGVLHSFTADYETAKQFLDRGWYLGLNGIITFKNAKDLHETVSKLPLDRLIVETDAPFLAPTPFRGKTNEPAFVRYVAEQLAILLAQPFSTIAEKTTENCRKLFGL